MDMRKLSAAAALALALGISGCATHRVVALAVSPNSEDVGDLVYSATRTLEERAGPLVRDRPILVATVVSMDDLGRSSTFGHLASHLVANKLSQSGYSIKDVTYLRAWRLKPGTGEMVLSEDAARVSASLNAQAVVAGTYAVAGRNIYLSLRMLRAVDGQIISSADVTIPLNHNTETIVEPTTFARAY